MKKQHIVSGIYFAALVIVWAWFCGAMVRGEMSPWVWKDYLSHVSKYGQGDALFSVALYLLFYSGGFSFPFVIVRGIAMSTIKPEATADSRETAEAIAGASILIAAGSGIAFVGLLPAIVAFFANLPAGWLLVAPVAALAVSAGIIGFRNARQLSR
jgi:hypothetical protein